MRRLLPLLLLVLVPSTSPAHADGCPPSSCGTTSSTSPGSRVILIRRTGQQGPAEGWDLVTGKRRFLLGQGVLSADGSTFATTTVVKAARGKRTLIRRYDAHTGRVRSVTATPGSWHVTTASADGRQLGLMQYLRRSVGIGVFGDGLAFQTRLPGYWEIESLSPGSGRIFLIHWNQTGGYTLQNIDTRTLRISPTKLDEPGEKMSGFAQTAVATHDGHWLLTLYLKNDGKTFLHALDLRSGLAHCVDLPLIGDFSTVGSTALRLSPDERTLYLASPFLGKVVTVDLSRLRVTRETSFRPLPYGQLDISVGPSAAVTPNGRMLAFNGSRTMWLYDTAYGVVAKRLRTQSRIEGLGFRPGGRVVVAITASGWAPSFDAATGARVRAP